MSNIPMQGLAQWLRADALDANPRNREKLNRWASEVESASARLAEATIAQPVAWMWEDNDGICGSPLTHYSDYPPGRVTNAIPLFAHPAPKGEDAAGVNTPDGEQR